jgi:hypothetical protein
VGEVALLGSGDTIVNQLQKRQAGARPCPLAREAQSHVPEGATGMGLIEATAIEALIQVVVGVDQTGHDQHL